MVRKVWKSNLFLLILIGLTLFLSVNIESDFELYKSEGFFSSESSQKAINSIEKYSDVLVLFRTSIPDLNDYEKFVIQKYSAFPVVRLQLG